MCLDFALQGWRNLGWQIEACVLGLQTFVFKKEMTEHTHAVVIIEVSDAQAKDKALCSEDEMRACF